MRYFIDDINKNVYITLIFFLVNHQSSHQKHNFIITINIFVPVINNHNTANSKYRRDEVKVSALRNPTNVIRDSMIRSHQETFSRNNKAQTVLLK
jgi:hypothetical protein